MEAMTEKTAEYRPLEAKPLEREETENSFTSPSFSESYHADYSEKCQVSPEDARGPSIPELIDGYLRQFLVLHQHVNGEKIQLYQVDKALIERDVYNILYNKEKVYTKQDEDYCEDVLNNLEIKLKQHQNEYKAAQGGEVEEGIETTSFDLNRAALMHLTFQEKVEAKVYELLYTDDSTIRKEIAALGEAEKPRQKSLAEQNNAYAHWVLGNLSTYKEHVAYLNGLIGVPTEAIDPAYIKPKVYWRKPRKSDEFFEETLERYKQRRKEKDARVV